MTAKARKRRSPGEGSAWAYKLKSGAERWAIGYVRLMPDGTRKSVTRREAFAYKIAAAIEVLLRKARGEEASEAPRVLAGA